MSKEGSFADKHPGALLDERIAAVIRERAVEGKLSCALAFQIARELGVSAADVGRTTDLLDLRISHCQLGLFGYGPENRIIRPAAAVTPELEQAIRDRLVEGRLFCAAAWAVADVLGISKLEVANACEALGVRLKACQLGGF